MFPEMKLSSNIKRIHIFSQKKTFLILYETEFSYVSGKEYSEPFGVTELSYISGNSTFCPYISLIFQEVTFQVKRIKKILYFMKWNFLAPKKRNKFFKISGP